MTYAGPRAVHDIIAQSGGKLVGRTKLQKSGCALEMTGLGYGFHFSYKHFGPYSETLKIACSDADALGLIQERRQRTQWGGEYSVFTSKGEPDNASPVAGARRELLGITADADPVILELAVTAAFLARQGMSEPWEQVRYRKADKATHEALGQAKELYQQMRAVRVPTPLPAIA